FETHAQNRDRERIADARLRRGRPLVAAGRAVCRAAAGRRVLRRPGRSRREGRAFSSELPGYRPALSWPVRTPARSATEGRIDSLARAAGWCVFLRDRSGRLPPLYW